MHQCLRENKRRLALLCFLLSFFPFCSFPSIHVSSSFPSLSLYFLPPLSLSYSLPQSPHAPMSLFISFPTTFFHFLPPIPHLLPYFVLLPFPSVFFFYIIYFLLYLLILSLCCSFITTFIPSPSNSSGDFLAPAASESWDRLRVTCSQPFNHRQPFGLMFLRVRSLLEPGEDPENSQAPDRNQVCQKLNEYSGNSLCASSSSCTTIGTQSEIIG